MSRSLQRGLAGPAGRGLRPRDRRRPKMLRNFVQIMRSGAVGAEEPRHAAQAARAAVARVAHATSSSSAARSATTRRLADVIRMVHPKPATASRAALYGYLIGQPYDAAALPELVKAFEAFKASPRCSARPDRAGVPPDAHQPAAREASTGRRIAQKAPWQMTADEPQHLRAARRVRGPGRIVAGRPSVCATRTRSPRRGSSRTS